MSIPVLADAQFGIARILRPYTGFAAQTTTTLTAPLSLSAPPLFYEQVTAEVSSTTGMKAGDGVWITDPATSTGARFTIIKVTDATHVVLMNDDAYAAFIGPTPLANPLPVGSIVSIGGTYQDVPSVVPIMFSQAGLGARDELAGSLGYSPNLIRGLSVPMGSNVLLWLPQIGATDSTPSTSYYWAVSFRLRNTYDFRTSRRSYHYPRAGEGVPDTARLSSAKSPRVVIPSAWTTRLYPACPKPASGPAGDALVTTTVATGPVFTAMPILPGGAKGEMQQGIANPKLGTTGGVGDVAYMPAWQTLSIPALGDEMMISLYKLGSTADVWDFTSATADEQLAFLFGDASGQELPDVGIYVFTGASPA